MSHSIPTWDAWEDICSYHIKPGDGSTKQWLGTMDPKSCRFCKRSEPEAKFRTVSHVIPAALGNRTLFSCDECDECNSKLGGPMEDDLAKFLSLPRAISRLPMRKGMPKIKPPRSESFIQGRQDENLVYFKVAENGDDSITFEDNGSGKIMLRVRTPTHRPINVAKSLARMMLFCINNDTPGFERVRQWVCGEVEWFPVPLYTLHLPGSGYSVASIMVHRNTKTINREIWRVSLMYSSFLILLPLPMDDWSLPAGVEILNYPEPIAKALMDNTSVFMIQDNNADAEGVAEAEISYSEKRQLK